jgi:hypothetical protein
MILTRLLKQSMPILTPATPSAAFPVGRKVDDPVTNFLNDVFTVPANLAGLPGMAVPAGMNGDGLPLGLQLLARPFDEATLYAAGQVLEDAAGFVANPTRRAGGVFMTSNLVSGATGDWEVVIGLEVHAQVSSNAKLFSGASATFRCRS